MSDADEARIARLERQVDLLRQLATALYDLLKLAQDADEVRQIVREEISAADRRANEDLGRFARELRERWERDRRELPAILRGRE